MPGEIEYRKFNENREKGMSFSDALEEELTQLAVDLGVVEAGTSFEELVKHFES